jgi:hypothetical protein
MVKKSGWCLYKSIVHNYILNLSNYMVIFHFCMINIIVHIIFKNIVVFIYYVIFWNQYIYIFEVFVRNYGK